MTSTDLDVIALANERMSIFDACKFIGMHVYDYQHGNIKYYCPFGEMYHLDGGTTKAMRVYPATNYAYCFACAERYTPVSLIARDRGVSYEVAADLILTETKYVPPDIESQWNDILNRSQRGLVDTDSLAQTLKVACSRMVPDWDVRQYDEEVSTKLASCLALLVKVKTPEDSTKWLSAARVAMRKVLGDAK